MRVAVISKLPLVPSRTTSMMHFHGDFMWRQWLYLKSQHLSTRTGREIHNWNSYPRSTNPEREAVQRSHFREEWRGFSSLTYTNATLLRSIGGGRISIGGVGIVDLDVSVDPELGIGESGMALMWPVDVGVRIEDLSLESIARFICRGALT